MGVVSFAPGFAETFPDSFRHEALFYSGTGEFVERTSAFIRDGIDSGEPVLALVVGPKIDLLRRELSSDADRVFWADMAEVGRNPGRIISVWRDFVAVHAGGRGGHVRGIGEPIWAGRTADELVESQRYESLINLAFAGAPARMLCPYDLASLDASVIDEAYRSHPFVTAGGVDGYSQIYRDLGEIERPFDDPLAEPVETLEEMTLTIDGLATMRRLVSSRAAEFGLKLRRIADIILAVNEIATNSLRHGREPASLRLWTSNGDLICEVSDAGCIEEPLAGRHRPAPGQDAGYGLWLANQLCDLVQMRSFPNGTVVRVRIALR